LGSKRKFRAEGFRDSSSLKGDGDEKNIFAGGGNVTTDIHGNGYFMVVIGPVAAGTYDVEFQARDGAGCNLIGGAGNGPNCADDFQSPGPFGTTTTITVP
jgi:hypothetical protein